jgi:hypothetical protein
VKKEKTQALKAGEGRREGENEAKNEAIAEK